MNLLVACDADTKSTSGELTAKYGDPLRKQADCKCVLQGITCPESHYCLQV
jgi:hypothetical protein